jgi:N-acylglucosamine 2-epimerase
MCKIFVKKAIKTFENIQKRKSNPKGKYSKAYKGTRDFKSLAGINFH